MADNPYAARPEGGPGGKKKNECPLDMPRGDSPEAKAERQRFWIERGNLKLHEAGMGHLHWQCVAGHYFIEERMEASRRAMLANPNYARAA
jgi:hypothetical protein